MSYVFSSFLERSRSKQAYVDCAHAMLRAEIVAKFGYWARKSRSYQLIVGGFTASLRSARKRGPTRHSPASQLECSDIATVILAIREDCLFSEDPRSFTERSSAPATNKDMNARNMEGALTETDVQSCCSIAHLTAD